MKLSRSAGMGARLDELNGYLQLGMVDEALAVANQQIALPPIDFRLFQDLVDGVLIYADDTAPWQSIVRTGFTRLSKSDQRKAGYLMLWFFTQQKAYEEARPFIPKRFTGPRGLVNLLFAMHTLLSLGRLEEAAVW